MQLCSRGPCCWRTHVVSLTHLAIIEETMCEGHDLNAAIDGAIDKSKRKNGFPRHSHDIQNNKKEEKEREREREQVGASKNRINRIVKRATMRYTKNINEGMHPFAAQEGAGVWATKIQSSGMDRREKQVLRHHHRHRHCHLYSPTSVIHCKARFPPRC